MMLTLKNESPWSGELPHRHLSKHNMNATIYWPHDIRYNKNNNHHGRENGCDWDESTCASAAVDGHLNILKWLRQNACPWDETTCSAAAGRGQLDVLEWALNNGCVCDES